jgi:glycosyltransferase involved in cell wall biosynthesis
MATAFFRVVDEWLRQGHQVDLYSPGPYVDPAYLVRWPGFRYVQVDLAPWKQITRAAPTRGLPRAARSAIAMGLSEAQRVVHEAQVADAVLAAHRAEAYDAFCVMNRLSRFTMRGELPVVSFVQGSPNGEGEFVRRRPDLVKRECGLSGWALLRAGYSVRDPSNARSLARSDFLVVPSAWTGSMYEQLGWPASKLAVLWPPVDLDVFTPAPRPANAEDFRFLWLGRVVPRKRMDLAFDALTRLRARRPGVRLVVIGGAGYNGLLRYRMPDLVAGAVRADPVPHDRVPALMAATDVLLQPSENENFGGSAAEALACGVPSVLGPTNGTADALEQAAFRFDRYDPDAVAAAMERAMDAVLADPAGIATRARAIAERNLAIPVVARRAADLVRDISDGWRGRDAVSTTGLI